ncbi:G-protein coupled receptor dmsr-1-like [Tubulanus polymorphus]|uniref:G-protein coupled receptor dmsr-1-like n=1 Tax=Tubulanus polymorphus TaxID=672921 RepID=UPI003DA276EC
MTSNLTDLTVGALDPALHDLYGQYNFSGDYEPDAVTDSPPSTHYWGAAELNTFSNWYRHYHGFIAAIVCVFGIIANGFNVIILTQRNMQSATNFILTALAVSDGLTMAAYFPFALYYYCIYGPDASPTRDTQGAAYFLLFYVFWSVVMHSISIWLTVTLALFRYIFIKYPPRGATVCSMQRAKLAVFLTVLATAIVLIPNYISHKVECFPASNVTNRTGEIHTVILAKKTETEIIIFSVTFWVTAILVKLLPCAMLTVLSILLVRCMQEAEKRRIKLRNQSKLIQREGDDDRSDRRTNRTTRMLLAVVVLFLICELPQGLLNLLSGLLPTFYEDISSPLGDLLDILALFNNGINFILYCTMSKQFRDTFCAVFLKPVQVRHSENGRGRFTLVPNNNSVANTATTMVTRTSDV